MFQRSILPGFLVLATLVPVFSFAEDKKTEPEELYEQLKDSEDPSERRLAKRWQGLIRRRQWTDISGKYKTFAKYLEHDPELKWVKLLALVKKGDEQSEKEIQVPLQRLDKKSQAVVKRIALTSEQIDKLLAESSTDSGTRSTRSTRIDRGAEVENPTLKDDPETLDKQEYRQTGNNRKYSGREAGLPEELSEQEKKPKGQSAS